VRRPSHLPEYAIEAAGTAWLMLVILGLGSLLWATGWPLERALASESARRVVMGTGVGAAVAAFAWSRWGARSGAHLNPAVTIAFLYLRKVAWRDAAGYVLAQWVGGTLAAIVWALGVRAAAGRPLLLATVPGAPGPLAAFGVEVAITGALMLVLLVVSNSRRQRLTPAAAGLAIALLVFLAAPLSGASLNPARSFASALVAGEWRAFWVYLAGPPFGALLAALVYGHVLARPVHCAKLCHREHDVGCICRCDYQVAGSGGKRMSL
jgi:aquaporin Z